MDNALSDGFLECLNADCLPQSFKLDQADGEFVLEPYLFIEGDALHLSLQLDRDGLGISEAPRCGFGPSIR